MGRSIPKCRWECRCHCLVLIRILIAHIWTAHIRLHAQSGRECVCGTSIKVTFEPIMDYSPFRFVLRWRRWSHLIIQLRLRTEVQQPRSAQRSAAGLFMLKWVNAIFDRAAGNSMVDGQGRFASDCFFSIAIRNEHSTTVQDPSSRTEMTALELNPIRQSRTSRPI